MKIICYVMNGLGNQMFQYARAYALAKKYNAELILDTTYFSEGNRLNRKAHEVYALDRFQLETCKIFAQEPQKNQFLGKLQKVMNKICFGFPCIIREESIVGYVESKETEEALSQGKNVYLFGFGQSEKYFEDCKALLKKQFQLRTTLSDLALTWKQKMKNSESVSIHIRRGDYLTSFGGTVNLNYYEEALSKIKTTHSDECTWKLFIFSDDPEWCKENVHFEEPFTDIEFVPTEIDAVETIHLMSSCKHNVLCNSSFSWWGGWLNDNPDKMVVAPYIENSIWKRSFYCEDWQLISSEMSGKA